MKRIMIIIMLILMSYSVHALDGDANGDKIVDLRDLILVAQNFESTNFDARADVNKDNQVNLLDLIIVSQNFGKTETKPICGDTQCNGDETCSTCPDDCGACSGGKLQFKSGFESNTEIGGSDNRLILNIDSSAPTGINDWDKLRKGEYLPWVIGANGYFQGGAMDIIQDPTDPSNKVLHLHNTELDIEENRLSRSQLEMLQNSWWVDDGTPNRFDKQFYRYRMYIPDNIRTAYSYSDWSRWYMIWESHSWVSENTRHGVYIKKDANSNHWYFQVVQERPSGYQNVKWENSGNQNVAVPFGEWFTFDVFFKYHEIDGEFFVAITREGEPRRVTAHYKGQTKYDTKLRDQMVFKMYHDRDYLDKLGETSQYYDDFEIWSDYPPGYTNN